MSRGTKPLSKRSSIWESTSTIPNYVRPQGWAVQDVGGAVDFESSDMETVLLDILRKNFAGMTLDPGETSDCLEFIEQIVGNGPGLSMGRLVRIIGLWLATRRDSLQTEYDEGYRELSFN